MSPKYPMSFLALVVVATLSSPIAAATVTGTIKNDCWHYPFNATPATRAIAPLFITNDPSFTEFEVRDGVAVIQWNVALPPALIGETLQVTSATIVYYDEKEADWAFGSNNTFGVPEAIQVFAAGFGAVHTEASWTASWAPVFAPQPPAESGRFQGGWIIPPSTVSTRSRDPFPRDLVTDVNVQDTVVGATSWGTSTAGTITAPYVPGAMTDAFPVTLALNVADPTVQAELVADLTSGVSSWVVTSTFDLAAGSMGPAESVTNAPQLIMSEGVGNTTYGTSQLAPSLVIEVVAVLPSSAQNWQMFE